MNINISNYGAWFLDYHEGTLPAEKTAELFLFLSQHPELKEEFESFSIVKLDALSAEFPDKHSLKKEVITHANVNDYLIAEMEGDLNLQERIRLKDFIKSNPQFEKDKALFALTKLAPGEEIYPDKKSLKIKIVNPYTQVLRTIAAAACLLFILGILYINERKGGVETAERTGTTRSIETDLPVKEREIITPPASESAGTSPVLASEDSGPVNAVPSEVKPAVRKKSVVHREVIPVQLAEKIDVINIDRTPEELQLAEVPLISSGSLHAGTAFSDKEKKTLSGKISELKDLAATRVNEVAGDEILYTQDKIADDFKGKLPLKSRVLKLVAWTVAKVSGESIIMKPEFDQSGNLASYQVSAGKFKYERDF